MSALPFMSMYYVPVAHRGHLIPGNYSYRQLYIVWVLGAEPHSSTRADSVLKKSVLKDEEEIKIATIYLSRTVLQQNHPPSIQRKTACFAHNV